MRFEVGRFDALRERLLAGGIAPRRVRRYLAELDDHLAELTDHERAAGYEGEDAGIRARALLGSDDELAESWLSNPHLKSFIARAPWAILPTLLVLLVAFGCLVWIPISMGAAEMASILNKHGLITAAWFVRISQSLSQSASFVTPPLVALAVTLPVRLQRLNACWALLPALILSGVLLGIGPRMTIEVLAHSASVGVGFCTPDCAQYFLFPRPVFALQLLLILAPALWLIARQYWRTKSGWRI